MKLKYIAIFLVAFFMMTAASCATKPVVIPDELTAAEMVQRAQEASDRNRYTVSLQYYEAILERFPDDMEYVCTAEYEIAFIYYKQKKYDLSKTGMSNLLERYNSPDEELLPQQYKVLANKILTTITDMENKSSPKAAAVTP
ncbi:MAG: tetratricopeptide repeat protein [Treponema sp.]|nr:tetratricopeptide repeat protein [Treponema sp.]